MRLYRSVRYSFHPSEWRKYLMSPIIPPGEGRPSSSPMSLRIPEVLKKRIERMARETKNTKHDTVLHMLRWAADAYDKAREEEASQETRAASP
jgi:hypothetical protein